MPLLQKRKLEQNRDTNRMLPLKIRALSFSLD